MSDVHQNPLLASLKLPGRIFQLPSRGIFYKDGELSPSIKDGEIHVRAMSAMDEIHLKNPDQLFSGQAVESVFRHCIDGIEKPSQLLSKDVDAIMMFLRTVTYGSSYEFVAKHTCEHAKEHSYIADIDTMIGNIKAVDPTTIDRNYSVTLQNGQVVKLRPNRYSQVLDVIKQNETKRQLTADDMTKNLKMMLLNVIDSVDGISDPALISEWVDNLTSPMVNRIADKAEDINDWGPNVEWSLQCKDCGQHFTVDIPLNPVSFFIE